MIDNVISKEVNQIFSTLQNDGHTMNILSDGDDSLSFQSFFEGEENIDDDQSLVEENIDDVQSSLEENINDIQSSLKINSNFANNEEMFEANDFDDTFIENEEFSNQNDHAQEFNISFENLTSNTQQRLLNMTVKKIQSSVKEDDVIVNYREQNYHTEYTIKYLHSVSRFIIKNAIFSLFVSKSSIKSLKSIFNSTLIRTYVRIVRDNKKNKK